MEQTVRRAGQVHDRTTTDQGRILKCGIEMETLLGMFASYFTDAMLKVKYHMANSNP